MEEPIKQYSKFKSLNVSRETCLDFEKFISMIGKKNKEINLISKSTSNNDLIRERHIVDTAQIIDFIDLNNNTTYDLGTGGGFPGIVTAIMMKKKKENMKFNLYEKSYHKSYFLREVIKNLNLNAEVIQKDIFKSSGLQCGTIMARAFKPLPIILDLVFLNFKSYKNLILFMGKNGEKILNETLSDWDFDYEKKKSITNNESFLLNIKNIKKKKN